MNLTEEEKEFLIFAAMNVQFSGTIKDAAQVEALIERAKSAIEKLQSPTDTPTPPN